MRSVCSALSLALLLSLPVFTPAAHAALVAHYAFEGDLIDSSGMGNHGSAAGLPAFPGTISFETGILGQAARFEGPWVVAPHSASLNLSSEMTLAAWINTSGPQIGIPKNSGVIWKGDLDGTAGPYELNLVGPTDPADTRVNLNDGSVSAIQGSIVNFDIWQHLAATYDGSSLSLYRNGVLLSSTAFAGAIDQEESPLVIGNRRRGDHLSNRFFGLMDEVRIYDNALSASEIAALATVPEPSTALVVALALGGLALRSRYFGRAEMAATACRCGASV